MRYIPKGGVSAVTAVHRVSNGEVNRGRILGAAAVAILMAASPCAQTARDIAVHVLNRTGFGPTPALVAQLSAGQPTSVVSYIASQLNPTLANESPDVVNVLPVLGLPLSQGSPTFALSLMAAAEVRAAYSNWQLNELMTRFWNDHFNRSWMVIRFYQPFQPSGENYATWFMKVDDDLYRANALGYFDTMLIGTAQSVAMNIYLDNYRNKAGQANENWARELMELFTMGQINVSTNASNYNQTDVVNVARCFTGWTVLPQGTGFTFGYDPQSLHDVGAKNLFAGTAHPLNIPPNTPATPVSSDGMAVLTHLAGLPATADFMVRKFWTLFFGDAPPTTPQDITLFNSAKAAWGTRGDIRAVLSILLNSTRFLSAQDRWNKVKSPLHFNLSMIRATGARFDWGAGPDPFYWFNTLFAIDSMAQPVFGFPSPDGYPLTNPKQISPSGAADRLDVAERILMPEYGDIYSLQMGGITVELWIDPASIITDPVFGMPPANRQTPSLVASFLLGNVFGDKPFSAGDLTRVVNRLGTGTMPLPNTQAYKDLVRNACEYIFSLVPASLH